MRPFAANTHWSQERQIADLGYDFPVPGKINDIPNNFIIISII